MKLKVLQLTINYFVSYQEQIQDEEGYFIAGEVIYYDVPKLSVVFKAEVDLDLQTNCIYTDGITNFTAINKNTIVNSDIVIDCFSMPKELILISCPCSE